MAEIEPYRPGLGRNKPLLEQLKEFQKNPRSLVFVQLAEAYRKEGLPHQALEILDEGLEFHPDLASAVIAKARCLFDLRRYAEALKVAQSAIQTNPQNLKAHKLQAEIYVRLGQRKAAMRALTHVVTLYPQDLEAVRALEELENLTAKQRVPVQLISRASVDTPPPTKGRIEDFQVGSVGEQLAALEETDSPDEPAVPLSSASEVSEETAQEEAEPTFATRTIAELYLRQGLKPKALKVLRKILKEDPENQWARETLQDLGTDGIVLPAKPKIPERRKSLEKRVKALEIMLARVRLMKRTGA